jgi:hypothetical protein
MKKILKLTKFIKLTYFLDFFLIFKTCTKIRVKIGLQHLYGVCVWMLLACVLSLSSLIQKININLIGFYGS